MWTIVKIDVNTSDIKKLIGLKRLMGTIQLLKKTQNKWTRKQMFTSPKQRRKKDCACVRLKALRRHWAVFVWCGLFESYHIKEQT